MADLLPGLDNRLTGLHGWILLCVEINAVTEYVKSTRYIDRQGCNGYCDPWGVARTWPKAMAAAYATGWRVVGVEHPPARGVFAGNAHITIWLHPTETPAPSTPA